MGLSRKMLVGSAGLVVLMAVMLNVVVAQTFDRRAMLENVANNVVIPAIDAFNVQALVLQEAVASFAAAPDAATLAAAQSAWRDTSLIWQPASILGTREVMEFHYRIYKSPTKTTFIDKFIAGDDVLDEAYVAKLGSNAVGLAAMEYLLFSVDGDTAVLDDTIATPRRLDYLQALADHLVTTGVGLADFWSPDGGNFVATFVSADQDGSVVASSLNTVTNELMADLEGMAKARIGVPIGIDDGEPRPQNVESYRSEFGTQQMIADLQGLQVLFMGGDGIGLDDYLLSIGQGALVDTINSEFATTIASMEDLTVPFNRAVVETPEATLVVYNNLKTLVRSLKLDMVHQLGLSVMFNDSDGD